MSVVDKTNSAPKIDGAHELLVEMLKLYVHAVNEIDDFFEYANESKADRARVHEILNELHDKMVKL